MIKKFILTIVFAAMLTSNALAFMYVPSTLFEPSSCGTGCMMSGGKPDGEYLFSKSPQEIFNVISNYQNDLILDNPTYRYNASVFDDYEGFINNFASDTNTIKSIISDSKFLEQKYIDCKTKACKEEIKVKFACKIILDAYGKKTAETVCNADNDLRFPDYYKYNGKGWNNEDKKGFLSLEDLNNLGFGND
jgi:hypothetical protein